MNGKYSRTTPEGTRDLLFEECLARREVTGRLAELFASRGYAEVMTPALEYYEMFAGEMAGMPQESLYKLCDNHGRLLVMRPDSTMPIARLVGARLKDAPLPLRLYYAQTVYRATPSMSGRSDEIMQSGIELLGLILRSSPWQWMRCERARWRIFALSWATPDFIKRSPPACRWTTRCVKTSGC